MMICIVPQPRSVTFLDGYVPADAAVQSRVDASLPAEGYCLKLTRDGIVLIGADSPGIFYGEQTLAQLRAQCGEVLPCLEIEDAPTYPYRSFHIDCARHFFSLDTLKTMIHAAAAFKLNRFHWHFSDDQGWRIESRVYPRLHTVGGKRQGDRFGAFSSDAEEYRFYTQEEVRELAAFCREHFIEIVPEVDMPGHVTAMLAAYPELSCTGRPQTVASCAGIFPDILCPGREETFAFLFPLLDELCELFPGRYFHIGGDETPKNRWKECPCCQARMRSEHIPDTRALQGYMTNRIAAHLRTLGKRTIVFNEAALGDNLDRDIIIQLWNDDPNDPAMKSMHLTDTPNQGIGARMLSKGHSIITANMLGSYCDYPYSYISLQMIHDAPLIPQKCENLPQDVLSGILGGEALIWTEYIRDERTLQDLAWPRFAAKADRVWSGAHAGDYASFAGRMKPLYLYLKTLVPNARAPHAWNPGPIRAAKEMTAFMKNMTAAARKSYGSAQTEI